MTTPNPTSTKADTPHLYALLVGIGAYKQVKALSGPANDAQAVERYIQQLTDFNVHPLVLTDRHATKAAVIDGFLNHLSQAGPTDTVLFFFAGHGVQEEADPDLWPTETDRKLESLVCYDGDAGSPWNYLLADKELRYLIGKVSATGAHIATIFDCCHSGDNTRSADIVAELLSGRDVRERQIQPFAGWRPYEAFCFHDEFSEELLRDQGIGVVLPQGAHVQIAACQSDETAKEVDGEGVFTKSLLAVLKASHGQLSYQDLHNRVRQYLRFSYVQRPRVYTPDEKTDGLLNRGFLNRPVETGTVTASILYNNEKGWLLDVGAIHGVGQTARTIRLHDPITQTAHQVEVGEIGADYTVLTIADDIRQRLDKAVVYRATVEGLLTQPIRLHYKNHDGLKSELTDWLASTDSGQPDSLDGIMILEDDEKQADYTLHSRNGLYYLARPCDENRPLVEPIRSDDPEKFTTLTRYLKQIARWQYLRNLRNPALDEPRLSVSITVGDSEPVPVTGANPDPVPVSFTKQADGTWSTSLTIRLTNTTNRPLFCTPLYLSRDFISDPTYLSKIHQPIKPGDSIELSQSDIYDSNIRYSPMGFGLEEVIRQYNWPKATEYFKLIVTTDPLSEVTLNFLTLEKLPDPPVLVPDDDRGGSKPPSTRTVALPQWSTQTITLDLINPEYNKVRLNELERMLAVPEDEQLVDDTAIRLEKNKRFMMADFALGLYYETDTTNPLHPTLKLRDELTVIQPDGERGLFKDLALNLVNKAANWSQNRQYRQRLVSYPDELRIVAEGDSWFQYPFLLRDVVDYLSGVYTVYSVAAAGATLKDYLKDSRFTEAINAIKPGFFLLSGGGNDLLGEGFAELIVDVPDPAQTGPERYLADGFRKKLTDIEDHFKRIFELVSLANSQVKVLVHGYDYVVPAGSHKLPGGSVWMGNVLTQKGVSNPAEREAVARYVIDAFNDRLRGVAAAFPNVTYLDLRGTIQRTERLADYWYDEIHPNDKGFLSVANQFVKQIRRLKGDSAAESDTTSSAADRWTDEFLWSKRQVGDPLADGVITTLLAENQKGEVDQIFQLLVQNRQFPNPAFYNLPEPVRKVVTNYFTETRALPDFAEPFKLMTAADVFRQHGPKILFILLCKSLPLCYTCWRGAKVLYRTGRLRVHDGSLDSFTRRLMETAQFVVDMLTHDNFRHDGTAIVAAQKVRLMHAIIRHFAQERNWDTETYGIPINQEDQVGTLLSFSVVIIDGLEQLGITLTPDERAAYLHLWHVVGRMMGIDEDLLSENEADCRLLMSRILDQQAGPSVEGAALTEACIDLMTERMMIKPLQRLSPYFVRFFIGDNYADMLSVPTAEADESTLLKAVQWFDQSIRDLDNKNRILASLGRTFSHGMIRQILAFTNAAKKEQFYLPSALTDHWDETVLPDFRIPTLERIDDVIFYLDKVARHLRAQNNPMGYFCAVYKLVTQRVAEGLRLGVFENPLEMEQVDVGFGNRYFEALNQYFDGQPATGPWQVSFDAAQSLMTTNQHIFVAANAHISFDLPIVVAEVYQGKDIERFKGDFERMNKLFDGMYTQMNDDIGRIFKPFGLAVEHLSQELIALENKVMKAGRDLAWAKSLELHQVRTDDERRQLIADLEIESATRARSITQPFALIGTLTESIAQQEFGTVAHKVDVMLRTALLPVIPERL